MIRFTFENPVYLWYLLSIPFLIYTHFYFMRHNRSKAMRFANFEALKRVTGEKLITKNYFLLILRVIILTCVIFAVSGIIFWFEGSVNQHDYILAIDASASMAAQDIPPSRFDNAKSISTEFIDSLQSRSNIGVVSFSSITFIETIPISNKINLKKIISDMNVAKSGGTDIPGAIITSSNLLLGSEESDKTKGKSIILITDGSNTVSGFISDSFQASIDYANENHIIIHTIGIGSESGPIGYLPEYYNISAVFNENILLDISNQTGGYYFNVLDEQGVEKVIEEIGRVSKKAYIPLKLSYGLMLIALVLLFIEWGLINTRFKKMP